jgi:hypothetical protein
MLLGRGGVMVLPGFDVVGNQTNQAAMYSPDATGWHATLAYCDTHSQHMPPPYLAATSHHPKIQLLWNAIVHDVQQHATHFPGYDVWRKEFGNRMPGTYRMEHTCVLPFESCVIVKSFQLQDQLTLLQQSNRLYFRHVLNEKKTLALMMSCSFVIALVAVAACSKNARVKLSETQ